MGLGIKKNDTMMVVSGDEKGKKGRVLAVYTAKNKVLIEGINMIKKHLKPSKQYSQGGIIEREAPLNRSNAMLVCPKCDNATKTGNRSLENGKKVRSCKKCGEVID